MISGPIPAGSPIVTAIILFTTLLLDKIQNLMQRGLIAKPTGFRHHRTGPDTAQKVTVWNALRHLPRNTKSGRA